jgi:hypothetical protein
MVMIALCSSLVGAVMGTRFKVQVLFPAAMLGCVMVAAVAVFKGSAMSSTIAAAIVCVISLQIGYLGGLFTRFCMAASRGTFYRSLRSTATRS